MDAITKEIRRTQQAIRDGHVSQRELARLAGIRDTTLVGCLDDGWNPTARTLTALSSALDQIGFFINRHRNDSDSPVAAQHGVQIQSAAGCVRKG
tara:strand:- start:368 stop:652 length:285 start_codon:yes stop_codon:yes gene_type:complete